MAGNSLIEYAAGFVRIADEGSFFKVFDTIPFLKPGVTVSKDKAIQQAKELGKTSANDLPQKKALNFQYQFLGYNAGDDVTILLVANNTVSEDKLQSLYEEIKREMTKTCNGSLKRLQDESIVEDHL